MPPKSERLLPDPSTILERSRGEFFAQWEELLRLRRDVLKSFDPVDIHDLRVASRRFRAALELYYPFAPKKTKVELKKSIRKLTRGLGGLRNIDEALLFFQTQNDADVSTVKEICSKLSQLRSRELKRIDKTLKDFDRHRLDRMVREMVAGLNGDSITEQNRFSFLAYFSDVSIRHYLPIHQLLAVSTVPENRISRHALRIAIKKWRYFLEIIAVVLDRDYSCLLGLLKEYQSVLGRMNDIAEFEVLLGSLELSAEEEEYVSAVFLEEDAHLLESFTERIEQKPLTYTFLV
jgi:CHAD domain-containing protein